MAALGLYYFFNRLSYTYILQYCIKNRGPRPPEKLRLLLLGEFIDNVDNNRTNENDNLYNFFYSACHNIKYIKMLIFYCTLINQIRN